MKPKIGVVGSCGEPISDHARAMARKRGESIGAAGYALITGASPGCRTKPSSAPGRAAA